MSNAFESQKIIQIQNFPCLVVLLFRQCMRSEMFLSKCKLLIISEIIGSQEFMQAVIHKSSKYFVNIRCCAIVRKCKFEIHFDGKTLRQGKRLNSSIRWFCISLLSNFKIFFGTSLGSIVFLWLIDKKKIDFWFINCLNEKKIDVYITKEFMIPFLETLIENWVLLEIFIKYLLNPLTPLYGLVKVILFSMTAGSAEFKELFKHIRFLISFRDFSEIINISFKIICKIWLFDAICKVYRRFPLRGKCPYSELFWSVFPAFGLNTAYLSVCSPNAENCRPQ